MLSIKASNWNNHYINALVGNNTDKMLNGIWNFSSAAANINAITTFTGLSHAKDAMLLAVALTRKLSNFSTNRKYLELILSSILNS